MHDLSPSTLPPRRRVGLCTTILVSGLAVAFALAAVTSPRGSPSSPAKLEPEVDRIAALRAQGPAVLEDLVTRHVRELTSDIPPAAAEAEFDQVAGQRYATVSRLYWYTDLELARQAARQLQRPILALRLLGDLREDLSCADSRLFRTTLYANQKLATFLRTHFVLYWSSVRPVVRVAIDLGDGRTLTRTTKDNAVHYVLDADGHVLDVLPGVYAPAVFQHELEASLALARKVRGATDAARIAATVEYHRIAAADADRTWLKHASVMTSALLSMRSRELSEPTLSALTLISPSASHTGDGDYTWDGVAEMIWRSDVRGVLDDRSRALVTRLYRTGPPDPRNDDVTLVNMIARLERSIAADTAFNQFLPRLTIRHKIIGDRETDFWALDAWIYEEVFGIPRRDPWLGLRLQTDFTGLPGDGAVAP